MSERVERRAVLFDWDDTLCGIVPHRYETIARVLDRLGLRLSRQRVHRAWIQCDDPVFNRLESGFWHQFASALDLGADDHADLVASLAREFDERETYRRLTIFDDVLDLLDSLRADAWQVGIVSNNIDAAPRIIEAGIGDRFAVVVTPLDTGGIGKPDPAIFHFALERLEVRPERAIYVGDTYEYDVLGARAAGLRALLLDRMQLAGAVDCDVLRSLADIHEQLRALA